MRNKEVTKLEWCHSSFNYMLQCASSWRFYVWTWIGVHAVEELFFWSYEMDLEVN